MQALLNIVRQKHNFLVRGLIKSNKINVNYGYFNKDGRRFGHVKITEVPEILYAIWDKNPSLVQSIIKSQTVDINHQYEEILGRTALHVAACEGSLEIVKILVEEGHADVNIESELGELPLHEAGAYDEVDVVRYLAEKGSKGLEDVEDML